MAKITTSGTATSFMQAFLPKVVTPLDIATDASCVDFVMARGAYLPEAGASVSSLINLADAGRAFTQDTGANQPVVATDASLGRDTLSFDADRARRLQCAGTPAFNAAYTMIVVFKTTTPGTGDKTLLGNYGVGTAVGGLTVDVNGQLKHLNGAASNKVVPAIREGDWNLGIGYFDGASRLGVQLNDGSALFNESASPGNNTALYLGDNSTSFGFEGAIDMAMMLNLDLSGGANAALFNKVMSMLHRYYGSILAVPKTV